MPWKLLILWALLFSSGQVLNAQESPDELPSQPSPAKVNDAKEDLFFADVLVRGQSVFQVGSLANLSATQRAQIINRRIAGLLSQSGSIDPVTVQYKPDRDIALLQVNNRVLMTVTQQDALDFDVTVQDLAEQWADSLNRAMTKPNLAVDVVQRLEGTSRQLVRGTVNNLSSFLGAIVVIIITWLVAIGVRKVGLVWAERTEGDRSTEILIGRLCYGSVWVLGAFIALGVLGLDFAALLGTLGLTSVAIGFSLKDVLSNYVSGVILLAARPFRINDQVVIAEYEGTVIQIQLRGTTIQTYDGRQVYIPNQEVFQSSVINNTASPIRRSSVMVGIDYKADINEAKGVIIAAISEIKGIESNPAPVILVNELAASTVNLEVRFWVDSRRLEFLQATSQVAQSIKEYLMETGIEMPTTIYTLAFQNPLTLSSNPKIGLPVAQDNFDRSPTSSQKDSDKD